MTVRLSRLQRAACFLVAGAAYAASGLSSRDPLEAETAFFRTQVAMPASSVRLISIADVIRRDPFAPTPAPDEPEAASQGARPAPAPLAAAVPIPPGLTVPDIAEVAQSVAEVPRTYVLKATIVGASSVAYVDDGTLLRVVRTGDVLGGRYVQTIDLRGITFSDGTRLSLPDRYLAPAETAHRPSRSDDQQRAVRTRPQRSITAPPATPLPTELPATPGPLPTVKQGAYPLGTAPTSDPAAPTAFPYPYTPH